MSKWTQIDSTTWIKDGCAFFVYRETDPDSPAFDAYRPFVVATVDHGEPTGKAGDYECFVLLRNALSCAQLHHDETTGAL